MKGQQAVKGLINKKSRGTKEVAEMKGLKAIMIIAVGLFFICLVNNSYGYQTISYTYRADGSVMTATTINQLNKVLSKVVYDGLGRTLSNIRYADGGETYNTVTTYQYNEVNGNSLVTTVKGVLGDIGYTNESTFSNYYGQAVASWSNVYDGSDADYAPDTVNNNSTQAWAILKGGDPALQGKALQFTGSTLANGLATTLDLSGFSHADWTTGSITASGLTTNNNSFFSLMGKQLKSLTTYTTRNGQATTYSFSTIGQELTSQNAASFNYGRALYVSEVTITGANGAEISGTKLGDPYPKPAD